MYQLLIAEFGVAPSEYWQMTPTEINLVLESKRPKHVGGIHEDDLADMMQRRRELEDQGFEVI